MIQIAVRQAASMAHPGRSKPCFQASDENRIARSPEGANDARRKRHASAVSWRATARSGAENTAASTESHGRFGAEHGNSPGDAGCVSGAARRWSVRWNLCRRGIMSLKLDVHDRLWQTFQRWMDLRQTGITKREIKLRGLRECRDPNRYTRNLIFSGNTLRTYERVLRDFVEFARIEHGASRVEDIGKKEFRAHMDRAIARGMAVKTLNLYRSALAKFGAGTGPIVRGPLREVWMEDPPVGQAGPASLPHPIDTWAGGPGARDRVPGGLGCPPFRPDGRGTGPTISPPVSSSKRRRVAFP